MAVSPARLLRIARHRLRSLVAGRSEDRALDDELAFHFEQLVAEKIADGVPADEAQAQARREFGNLALFREQTREARRVGWLHDLREDLIFGSRLLRKHPVFTITAIASLAIAIGANAAVWGATRNLLFEPLPFPDADRLVVVRSLPPDRSTDRQGVTLIEFATYKERAQSFQTLGASMSSPKDLGREPDGTPPERVASQAFTPDLLMLLGVQPERGSLFEPVSSAFHPAARVALISHRLWQRRYNGADDVVGRVIDADGRRTVIGVMPAGFRYQNDDVAIWVPLVPGPNAKNDRGSARILQPTGRLRPGVTLAQAQAELEAIFADLQRQDPDRFQGWAVRVFPLREAIYGWTRPALYTLTSAVALVLVIACANIAGLLLARATTRRREMWVRVSLGAARGRIVRQLITESLLIAFAGAIFGLALAVVGLRSLSFALGPPPGLPRVGALEIDASLVILTFGLAVVTAIVFATVPAIVATRPSGPMSGGSSTANDDRSGARMRGAIVAAELALATIVLVGAGLLFNSFYRLTSRSLNFDPDGVVSFDYTIPLDEYAKQRGFEAGWQAFDMQSAAADAIARMHDRLRTEPGFETLSAISYPPVNSLIVPRLEFAPVDSTDTPAPTSRPPVSVPFYLVMPGAFDTLRLPLLRGRDFTIRDRTGSPPVVVVNAAAARLLFPGREAIGGRLRVDLIPEWAPFEVVGVVADVPILRRSLAAEPVIYATFFQPPVTYRGRNANMFGHAMFIVRTDEEPARVIERARRAAVDVDPARALLNANSLRRSLDALMPELQNYVAAVAAFGLTAMLLAAIGVYGVTSFAVAARTREVGIRRVLGAGSSAVVAAIGRRTIWLIGLGVGSGMAIATLVAPLIRSQLYAVAPTDPSTLMGAAALLVIVAVTACLGPIRRALAVDPAAVLRSE